MSTEVMKSEQPRRNRNHWYTRAQKNKNRHIPESETSERGGNWIVETGEVSAPDARFTNSLAESRALQERLRVGGGVGEVAAKMALLSESDKIQLADKIARPYAALLEDICSQDALPQ